MRGLAVLTLVWLACTALGEVAGAQNGTPGWTIRGAQVADGTGAALRRADVRFVGDTIVEVGTITPRPDDRVIDGAGLVLAPGVIDAHNHSTEGLDTDPAALTQISQGITTLAVGQDGSSPFPLRDYLVKRRASPSTVNVAVLVGHATLRRQVMGADFRQAGIARGDRTARGAGRSGNAQRRDRPVVGPRV